MQNTWLVIVPPLLVLVLSFVTHRVALSLFIGIITATLISHNFGIIPAIKTMILRLWETVEIEHFASWEKFWNSSNLFIYIFLLFLGVLIVLISKSGGTSAYGTFVQKKLHDKRAAETSSLILSFVFFIDEYLNILTVGSVMYPITDRFHIARAKLAFLVNSMAASLCILVPISSWGAFVIAQINNSGVDPIATSKTLIISTPFALFMKSIPFAFYSFIIIVSVIFIVRKKLSFGPMHIHETIAQTTHNLFAGKTPRLQTEQKKVDPKNNSMVDFLFPLLLLVISVFASLFLTDFIAAPALFIGGTITLVCTIIFFLLRKKIIIQKLPKMSWEGINLMLPSLLVVTLAWTFSNILIKDLATGQFLASQLTNFLNPKLFPVIFFVATTLTTLAIGSAWGSMAVMIPIALPMLTSFHLTHPPILLADIPMLLPTLSSILAGSIAGIHISPISDVVIMASTSTGAYHMDHVKTQQIYIIPVFIATTISFWISGLLMQYPIYINVGISSGIGISISLIIFYLLDVLQKRKKQVPLIKTKGTYNTL